MHRRTHQRVGLRLAQADPEVAPAAALARLLGKRDDPFEGRVGCGGRTRLRSLQLVPGKGLPVASNAGAPPRGATVQKRRVKLAASVLVIVHVDWPPGSALQSGRYQMCVPL